MASQRNNDSNRLRQAYTWNDDRTELRQTVTIGERRFVSTIVPRGKTSRNAEVAWVQAFLRGSPISWPVARHRLRAIDLFCAAGGMTLGLKSAARSIGIDLDIAFATDADVAALGIYTANHGPCISTVADVQSLVSYQVSGRSGTATWGTRPTIADAHMRAVLDPIDVVIAGPPCQGHSNFNNKTRREDSRNLLYVTTAAFAVAVNARLCIIENVPDVLLDRYEVVETTRALLTNVGYAVSDAVLAANDYGVGQRRRRHFLIAVKGPCRTVAFPSILEGLVGSPVTLRHVIGDLATRKGKLIMDMVGTLSPDNENRINWLFKHKAYDLPDKQRPDCHKNGHTYPSVYGRMKWDEPTQTITTGFLCPGRGRYVHPSNRRTVTPREAARIQGFPDSYDFCPPGVDASRMLLGKVIGDAVPPLLARAVCLAGLMALPD
jgi:DNA (cytosine-5)-methyltransferase 1